MDNINNNVKMDNINNNVNNNSNCEQKSKYLINKFLVDYENNIHNEKFYIFISLITIISTIILFIYSLYI